MHAPVVAEAGAGGEAGEMVEEELEGWAMTTDDIKNSSVLVEERRGELWS